MITVISPVLNEEQSLEELYGRVAKVLKKDFELIFVNDGSTDNSVQKIKTLVSRDKRVRLVDLGLHLGKAKALMAGFTQAKGEIIITLDADLQDLPEEMPKLIKKIDQGYDLVSGWKKKRNDSWLKVVTSRIFNFSIWLFTSLRIHDINCGFKAYKRQVIDSLNLYGDLYRFIPILAINEGFKVTEVEVKHDFRKYGKSKYGLNKGFRGLLDLFTILFLTKFKNKPLHFFGTAGLLSFLSGFIISFYLTVLWFQGESIGRRPLLILGILLLIAGIQLFTTGLLAELIVNTLYQKDDKKQ